MATDKTQATPRYCPAPVHHTVPITTMSTTPPSHPPLEYEDEQRFRNYVWSIDFADSGDDFKDQMFKQTMQLPQPESLRTVPPEELQRRAQDYPPVRGTGLGKGKGRGKGQPHRQLALNMSHVEHERSQIDSVRESPTSETKKFKGHSQNETSHGDDLNDDGNSSDDCAWTTDSEAEDIEAPVKVQGRSVQRKPGAGKRVPEKPTERDRVQNS